MVHKIGTETIPPKNLGVKTLLTGSTQNLNTPIGTAIMIRTTKFKRPITCVCVLFSIFNQSFLSIRKLIQSRDIRNKKYISDIFC